MARTDDASDVVSRHFNVQIASPEDLEKIDLAVLQITSVELPARRRQ